MSKITATQTSRPRPINGWALETLIQLATSHPEILRFAIQASPLRRQAVFLTLSHLHFEGPEDLAARLSRIPDLPASSDPLTTICTTLMCRRVGDLVQALHPGVEGLLGSLRRLGADPLHPLKYRALVHMLSQPDRRRARVLRQLEVITENHLAVLRMIDSAFLYPDLIRRLSVKDVEAFNAVIDIIRKVVPGVTDEALLTSLKALGPTSSLEAWAQRWAAKAVFPALPPIHDDEEWVALRTAEMMRDAAARFRNCLRDKIGAVALGRALYIECRAPEPAIIELNAFSSAHHYEPRWAVEAILGKQNRRVRPATVSALRRKLLACGILLPAHLGHARRYNKAARLLDAYAYGGLDGFHGVADEMDEFLEEVMQEAEAA